MDELERACAETGRDPATLRRVWSGGCACAPTEAEVAEPAGNQLQVGKEFVGTPVHVIEQMRPYIELAVDCFLLDCGGFPILTTAETLVDEVFPVLDR